MAVPSSVVTVTPAKPVNAASILKSSLGVLPTPSNDPGLRAETSVAAQTGLPPTVNVNKASMQWITVSRNGAECEEAGGTTSGMQKLKQKGLLGSCILSSDLHLSRTSSL